MRSRLQWVMIIAAVIVPIGLFAAAAVRSRAVVMRGGEVAVINATGVLEKHVGKVLETAELALAQVDNQIRDLTWDRIASPTTSQFLARFKAPMDQIVSIWISDASGGIRAGSQPWDPSSSATSNDFFRAQQENDVPNYIGAMFRGKNTHVLSFAVSRRRSTRDGQFDGVIHIALSPEYFARFFAEATPDIAHAAVMLRSDGEILARSPFLDEVNVRLRPDSPLMQQIALRPAGGYFSGISTVDGIQRMSALRKVGPYPVYVSYGVATELILHRWNEELILYGTATIGMELIIMTVVALLTARGERAAMTRLNLTMTQLRHETAQREFAEQQKSRFFANVSHELRTPLALILGPVDALLGTDGLPPRWSEELGVVRRNAQTLLAYVTDLLDLSRFDAGRLRPDYSETDLAGIIRFVADHFSSSSVLRRVELSVTAPDSLIAQADRSKIVRVLFNLVSNAFKFVPAIGGQVAITLRLTGGAAVIEVTDNGPGVPIEIRQQIFQWFVQGSDSQSNAGSGLGLAVAKDFVELHGGNLVVEDVPVGTGALFRVTLPLVAAPGTLVACESTGASYSLPPTSMDVPAEPASECNDLVAADALPLVLVVEDNCDLRAFISRSLQSIARVAVAGDGVEGLAEAERLRPDLILTDIMMPRMTGDRMVAELRSRSALADTPVMVLSARADEPLRIRLLQGQAQDYLVKPFAADELLARASNLLQVKRARDLLRVEVDSRQDNLEALAHEVGALTRTLRQSADEMRVARDNAEQAVRAKSAFLSMVSHELRTPLTQLELQLELHRRLFRDGMTDKQSAVLARVTAAMQRLSKLVASVLEYSRIQSDRLKVEPQTFDVCELVREACAEIEPEAKRRGLAVEFDIDGAVPDLVSDPALVGITVRNLLDNAIKYTPQGKVSATVGACDGQLHIRVADTGPGIPAAFQERMYQPFEQAEDVDRKHTPGVGLGLALVKEISELLGGRIGLLSVPEQGSVFTLELPL